MDSFALYKDIEARTKGEIYLGIVGPVRTGKSTFIKRFMDICVIPAMEDKNNAERTRDELPQSATGTTIMTTEPKFVPNEAAQIKLSGDCSVKVRLIDCVGFMVEGATGHTENDKERMVKTPWSDAEIPFTKAAEIGTTKVITEHSTIGIVVTCDGSFGDIDRANYIKAEERTVKELLKLNKPFVMILNSATPYNPVTKKLAQQLSEKYKVSVLPINCDQLRSNDITNILEHALYEFPISQINFYTPPWMEMLSDEHWLKQGVIDSVAKIMQNYCRIKDFKTEDFKSREIYYENEYIESITVSQIDLAKGNVNLDIKMIPNIYFGIISELTGTTINNEYELIQTIRDLSGKKKSLSGMTEAINQVELNGFGVVTPQKDNIYLEEPEVIKNGNKYGVRIKASAPSINLLKTNISVEIAPIVGSEQQANDLIEYIKENKQENPDGIWETNIFGKTIGQIVDDGIREKTRNITPESMTKISDTLEKVMNENTGLVCLIV